MGERERQRENAGNIAGTYDKVKTFEIKKNHSTTHIYLFSTEMDIAHGRLMVQLFFCMILMYSIFYRWNPKN